MQIEGADDFFRAAIEAAPTGMLIVDARGTIVLVNRELERLFGYSRAELVGHGVEMLLPARFREAHVTQRARYFDSPVARRMGAGRALVGMRKDRTEIPVEVGLIPVRTKEGSFVLSSIADVSERRLAEREREALMNRLAREEKFKAIFEHSPIAMAVLDKDIKYAQVNGAWTKVLGYEAHDIVGKSPEDITPLEDRARDQELIQALARGEVESYSHEKRYLRRDGSVAHVLLHAAAVPEPGGGHYYIGQIQDITVRVKAEQAVQKLQAELASQAEISATVLRNMPRGAVFLMDRNLRYLSADGPSVPDLLHVPADELLGRTAAEMIPEPYREEVLAKLRSTLEGRETLFEAVRGERTFEVRTAPIYRGESTPAAALIHLYDITERKSQERSLENERERFRTLVTHAPIGIFEMDLDGNVLYMNDQWLELTGLSAEEARSAARRLDGVHPDDRERTLGALADARAHGTGFRLEFRYSAKGGSSRRLSTVAAPLRGRDGAPTGYIGVTVDATAQLNAADAVARSLREKETLLKEIHHRVKNNLQVVGSIVGLQANRTSDPSVRGVFDELRGRIHAIARLHERLYRSPDIAAIDLGEYLEDLAADALRTAGGAPDRLRVSRPPSLTVLGLDEAVPVGLIVNELVTNAVKHGVRGTEKGTVELELALEGDGIRVIVSDDGPGFPDGFVPDEKKTLGMLLVKNLTRQLRGEVEFSSRPTRVKLRVPLSRTGQP